MIEIRHPHPHVDPRSPRNHAEPAVNPPVFSWKPLEDLSPYTLEVSRDPDFKELVLKREGLGDSVFLPEKALESGTYYWRWKGGGSSSDIFDFKIPADAVTLEVPPVTEWLQKFSSGHPRLYLDSGRAEQIQHTNTPAAGEAKAEILRHANQHIKESHTIEEPPELGDRDRNYQEWFSRWYTAMWGSRNFMKGAEWLALAYVTGGGEEYGRAACRRMVSISQWDPEGTSYLGYNDEAHMSVIWHGAKIADWVWDLFTPAELETVITQYRRRGEITFEHMHSRGCYGIDRFDSHAGREIVFLALLAITFHEHIPAAQGWLEWLRPVLCGIWPVWAGSDGAWGEGPSYGLAYVCVMTMFATALKAGTGVDLYRKPFWRNHASWRRAVLPPYAEWIGFGDNSTRWVSSWQRNADLLELISLQLGLHEFDGYIEALRREASNGVQDPEERKPSPAGIEPQVLLLTIFKEDSTPGAAVSQNANPENVMSLFPAAGYAVIRSNPDFPKDDIAFIFRSSPLGAISHSHANNNDFILHAGGKVLLQPAGFYAGYGSPHHSHYVWHTKSHNCATLSDSSQLMRSYDSVGSIESPYEDDTLSYVRGTADASYQLRAERCRRHIVYFKQYRFFLLIDEFVPRKDIISSLQWNAHSFGAFRVSEEEKKFQVSRGTAMVEGFPLWNRECLWELSSGWSPEPIPMKGVEAYPPQYHVKFTPHCYPAQLNLGMVLIPKTGSEVSPLPELQRWGENTLEYFQYGDIEAALHTGNPGHHSRMGINPGNETHIADITFRRDQYKITTAGIQKMRK